MLRIATFNLENLDDGPQAVPPLEERIPVLRPQLEDLHADILCLQEVNGQKTNGQSPRTLAALDRLLENTAYADFHRAFTERPDGKGAADKHNLVVLSRFPITAQNVIRHQLVAPLLVRMTGAVPNQEEAQPISWDRPVLQVEISLENGDKLHLINLHLRAPLAVSIPGQKLSASVWKTVAGWAEGYYLASMKRSGQALEARLLVDQVFDEDPGALVAVCGDVNADDNEVPVRILKAELDDTDNPDLAGRMLTDLDERLPEEQRYSIIHHGRHQMLDHILVSQNLAARCRCVEVMNQGVRDEYVDQLADYHSAQSHHAPMVVLFDDE